MRPARPVNPTGTGAARSGTAADRVAAHAHDWHTTDRRPDGHPANGRRTDDSCTGGHSADDSCTGGHAADDNCTSGHAANGRRPDDSRTGGHSASGRRTSGSHPYDQQDPHEDQHQEREQYA